MLSVYGHDVRLADDGTEARRILEGEHVDLIVSDVFMPSFDGNRFHSYVRSSPGIADTPFIFYSGYQCEEIQNIVTNSDIDFFLSKSSPVEDIISLIEQLELSKGDKEEVHDESTGE